jgi:hypothetical protein
MAKILVPEKFRENLGPSMHWDVHWVDVKLINGQILKNLVVRESTYITGFESDNNGESDLPFVAEDIADLRRTSILPFWLTSIFK